MTYAPEDILALRVYVQSQTGQGAASLGIAGDSAHASTGGYHEGHDDLHRAGRAPEDAGSDYSYSESSRDRSGLTDAASAFDLGGDFARFREITLGVVAACQRGDSRCRDVREVIYTPDGSTVHRWDRLGKRTTGDSSHLFHTHVSFFRDGEGRRNGADNFLGLLRELFEGADSMSQQSDNILAAIADGLKTYTGSDGQQHTLVPTKDIYDRAGWEHTVDAKLDDIGVKLAATGPGGQPTQDQVNAAMLKALQDPAVLAGLGAAIASHMHVS